MTRSEQVQVHLQDKEEFSSRFLSFSVYSVLALCLSLEVQRLRKNINCLKAYAFRGGADVYNLVMMMIIIIIMQ